MNIAGREIGPRFPPYIVAEMSANHLGSLRRALAIMDAAKEAGADAVKLQTYAPADLASPDMVIAAGPWAGRKARELYAETYTPWSWHPELFEYGRKLELTVFSTPFSTEAVDFLEKLGCPAYKIASFEVTDRVLVQYADATGKPLVISTGMADADEIAWAIPPHLPWSRPESGGTALLHCVSAYPAPAAEMNLGRIRQLAESFRCTVGLSDHTLGSTCAIAATALRASIIEKHLTLKRSDGGPDAAFSAESEEFAAMVKGVHECWAAIQPSESPSQDVHRHLRGRTLWRANVS